MTAVAPAAPSDSFAINFTGAQKSAILCMVLGTATSAKLMQMLTAEEVEQISLEIAALKKVDRHSVDSVLDEYKKVAKAAISLSQGGVDYARKVLDEAIGSDRASDVLKRIQDQLVDTGLRRLKKAAPELLQSVLRGEHPQTIALILSNLDARQAADVIESMEVEIAGNVLHRVARMEKVSPEMLQLIETALSGKTDLSLSEQLTLSGGPAAVASVLNLTSASVEKTMLEAVAERSEELAEAIRNLMFTFEDLKDLDAKSIQRILREVEGKELALALRAASDDMKQHILKNMSERAAAALLEEMEFMGPVRVKDVEDAQAGIIRTVRSLEEAGEVILAGRGGGDEMLE